MATHDVTDEMHERGVKLCRQFIGDSWANITKEELSIERVKGGLSNEIYHCTLNSQVATKAGEPREVILRIYGQILYENPETIVTDSVIYGLLAEKKMGPKLYGIFTGGRVEEYVKSHTLFARDLQRECISLASAEIMGGFHRLKMPLIKEPRWLFETTTRYLDDGLNNLSLSNITDKAHQDKVQQVLSYRLSAEYECLKRILARVDSPVVFCHNDLQEGNILYKESPSSPEGWQLVPIDFEYASYNYRGYDIANHLCEWMYEYHVDRPPYFRAIFEEYPTREQQRAFCERYLQAYYQRTSRAGSGDSENGSRDPSFKPPPQPTPPEGMADTSGDFLSSSCKTLDNREFDAEVTQLMLEVDAYRLMSHFFWGIWAVVQSQISDIKFGYLDYALVRFEHYFLHKKELLDCKTFVSLESS